MRTLSKLITKVINVFFVIWNAINLGPEHCFNKGSFNQLFPKQTRAI